MLSFRPMKRLLLAVLVVLGFVSIAQAQYVRVLGVAERTGTAIVSGISSTNKPSITYPGATITIYNAGTVTPATIFSTSTGTAKANPYTASLTDATYDFFIAPGATFDVRVSGTSGGVAITTFTRAGYTAPGTPGTSLALCGGTDDTALLAALNTINATIQIPNLTTCASNTQTISVALQVDNGGLLKPITGQTISLTGSFNAGGTTPHQAFTNATAGLGTVTFASSARLREVYPEWWGCVANGSTACQASFDAAIASFPNNAPGVNGGVIKLGVGNYRVTGLTITDVQAHIVGSGSIGDSGSTNTVSTIISTVSDAPILNYARGSLHNYRVRLENVTLVGNSTGTSQHGIVVDNGGIVLNNVSISLVGGNGLFLQHSVVGSYNNLEIHQAGIDGIRSQPSASVAPGTPPAVTANTFYHVSIGGTAANQAAVHLFCAHGNNWWGLDVENGTYSTISTISNAAAAVITTSSAHGFTTGQTTVIRGNGTFEGTTLGAALLGAQVVTVLTPTTFSVPVDSSALSGFSGTATVNGTRGIWFDREVTCTQETTYNGVYGYWSEATAVDVQFNGTSENNVVIFSRRDTGQGAPIVVAGSPGTGNRYDDYNAYATSQTQRLTGRVIIGDDSAQIAGAAGLKITTGNLNFVTSGQMITWGPSLAKLGVTSSTNINFVDSTGTDAGSINLGPGSAAFTQLLRNGTGVDVRNGDNSAYGPLTAKNLIVANTGVLRTTPKTNNTWGAAISLDVSISNHDIAAVFATSATSTITPTGAGTAGDWLFINTINGAGGSVVVTFASTFHSSGTQTTQASRYSSIAFRSTGSVWVEQYRTTDLAFLRPYVQHPLLQLMTQGVHS